MSFVYELDGGGAISIDQPKLDVPAAPLITDLKFLDLPPGHRMARKNKNKTKTAAIVLEPAVPVVEPEDDDLMGDLLAQLDSRDQTAKEEPAAVLNEMHIEKRAEKLEAKFKQSAKERFQARQVSPILHSEHYQLIGLKGQGQESGSPGPKFRTG
jgi:hypothetical protein